MEIPSSLIDITHEVGNDLTLVQGPGGNISFKNDCNLFIKASGTKMSDAKKKNIFIEVDLKKINLALENNEPDPIKNSYKKEQGMRPSIETTMHAIMPHKYVLHVHCVNSLSWIVQKNYESKIYPLIKNIKWISVPYKKPGLNLSKALKEPIKKYNPDVIFLSNHGIIAGAETAHKVLKLIRKVSESLSPFKKENINLNLDKIKNFLCFEEFKLPKYEHVHKLGLFKDFALKASEGILFPDQAVFLKEGFAIVNNLEELRDLVESRITNFPVVLIPNVGTLVPSSFKDVNEDNLLGLSMTICRIPNEASINYLSKEDKYDLINWDLEKYRQKMNS